MVGARAREIYDRAAFAASPQLGSLAYSIASASAFKRPVAFRRARGYDNPLERIRAILAQNPAT